MMRQGPPVSGELAALLARARRHTITPEERRAQAISFAYGNLSLHDPSITRADIERAYDTMYGGQELVFQRPRRNWGLFAIAVLAALMCATIAFYGVTAAFGDTIPTPPPPAEVELGLPPYEPEPEVLPELPVEVECKCKCPKLLPGDPVIWPEEPLRKPEPRADAPDAATLVLFGSGIIGLATWRRRCSR